MSTIQAEHFTQALYNLLEETFERVHERSLYLDEGTSLFETLATVSAAEASLPVGGKCATLAAQVKHTAFYLDVLEQGVRAGAPLDVDWGQIWRETSAVTPEEWEAIKQGLHASYGRVRALIADQAAWPSEQEIGGAISLVVHTAYHLGEIRQALCTLKP